MEQFLFLVFALGACGGALAVVLSQNVVRMALSLVVSLVSVAGLFFLLHADFVGATQILIYVGGTVVLLIFGVMLTSTGPHLSLASPPGEILKGAIVAAAFLLVVASSILAVDWKAVHKATADPHGQLAQTGFNPPQEGNTSRSIGLALLGLRFDQSPAPEAHDHSHPHSHSGEHGHDHSHAHDHSHGHAAAAPPATNYLLPFEIVSVHLLVVLVGAAYLARAKRRSPVSVR